VHRLLISKLTGTPPAPDRAQRCFWCSATGLTCPPSPESALSGRPGQRGGGGAKSAPGNTVCCQLLATLTATLPGARARPGRAGSALGDHLPGHRAVFQPPLFIQQVPGSSNTTSNIPNNHMIKKNNICVLEHLFPRAADIT